MLLLLLATEEIPALCKKSSPHQGTTIHTQTTALPLVSAKPVNTARGLRIRIVSGLADPQVGMSPRAASADTGEEAGVREACLRSTHHRCRERALLSMFSRRSRCFSQLVFQQAGQGCFIECQFWVLCSIMVEIRTGTVQICSGLTRQVPSVNKGSCWSLLP